MYVVPLCQWAVTLQGWKRENMFFSVCFKYSVLTYETAVCEHRLDNACYETRTVQGSFVLGHADEHVYERLLLDDVVRPLVVVSMLQLLRFLSE